MSEDKKTVSELWVELKATMEALEKDVMKNTEKSNVSAGVRLRKGVRALRAVGAELIRSTTQADKDLKEKRKAEKAAKKAAETPAT
jgi:Holliday junction resolvasome RuvABC DNA-binding subunit